MQVAEIQSDVTKEKMKKKIQRWVEATIKMTPWVELLMRLISLAEYVLQHR
jgi:hypothetical protein